MFTLKEPTTPGAWFDIFWTVGPTALALLAGLVIGWLVLLTDGLISRTLGYRRLSRQGRDLSYGMYLWHLPVYILLIPLVPSLAVRVPLTAALTVLLAYGSFRFVERPIRRWASRRLAPDVVRPVTEPAGVSSGGFTRVLSAPHSRN
ncbi:acyltransferase family protein [Arthrobacter sp. MDT3-24]